MMTTQSQDNKKTTIARIPVSAIAAGGTVPAAVKETRTDIIDQPVNRPVNQPVNQPVRVSEKAPKPKREKVQVQGTAALIIGVVFVVLAGLIFATTAWRTMPSFSKVIMILVFAGIFFGVSQLAGRLFKIYKTSQAFYILGSVFLFLTVLAAGYFKLFGFSFSLAEEYRFKVLFAGSLVTELAMIAGVRQFKDRIYTQACFWGMSVTMFFLIRALSLGTIDSIKAVVCYSSLLVIASEWTKERRAVLPSYLNADFTMFAELHFWIFSTLIAVFAVTEWPVAFFEHLYRGKGCIAFSTTLAIGMTTAGLGIMVLKQGRKYLQVMFSLAMIVLLHYLGMSIPVKYIYQVLISAGLTGVWLLSAARKNSPFVSTTGDWFHLVALAFDTVMILLIAIYNWDSMSEYLAAFASVIVLTAVLSQWGRTYKVLRYMIPFVMWPLTVVVNGMFGLTDVVSLQYSWILFLFLAGVAVWDLIKRDYFAVSVLVIGSLAELLFQAISWSDRSGPSFALLLSGYLFIKSCRVKEDVREWYEKGSCLYLLAGVFSVSGNLTDIFFFRMLGVTAVFAAEYAVLCRRRKEESSHLFWQITGVILLLGTMSSYYQDGSLTIGYMFLCLVIFAVFYIMFYRSGGQWAHLIAALSVLPVPAVAFYRYHLTEHQLYGYTALALFLSMVWSRRYLPIVTCPDEDNKGWRFDWFHILIILLFIPMTLWAGSSWRSAYLLLTAVYLLQYRGIGMLRRKVLTIASALAVLAFWNQPFITIPARIELEVWLAPTALFIWYLGYVWKDKKEVFTAQRVLYCLCLAALIIDALITGSVVDALILEIVCLSIFVWANIRKHTFWLRVAGTVIVVVALYMTKAFWLSLSWWFYLLVAGLGLIIFAAVNEMKKQK